jgi:hypothetical protein
MTCRSLVLTAAAAIALVAWSAPPSAHLLTAAEIRKLIGTEGLTSYGTSAGHQDFIAYIAPDGTITTKFGAIKDHGAWRIEPDGHFCVKYHVLQYGQEVCALQYQDGNDVYSVQDGILVNVTHKRVPGNPEHL